MKPALQTIELKEIKLPSLFEFSFLADPSALHHSIRQFGVLTPVLLEKGEEGYFLIDGALRVEIARSLDFQEIPSRVYEFHQWSQKDLFRIGIEANRWVRTFNLLEKAKILQQAKSLGEGFEQEIFSLLEITNFKEAKETLTLLELPQSVWRFAISKNIPRQVLSKFLNFSPAERKEIADLLFDLPLGQNKLSEILEGLYEISHRDKVDPTNLLKDCLRDALDQQETILIDRFREKLRQKRNPCYERKKKNFQKALSTLGLPSKVRVTPSPYFESDFIELSLKISTLKDKEDLILLLKQKAWGEVLNQL